MTELPLPWFIAQLKPNGGALAKRNLQRQDIATFLPQQEITRRNNDKLVTRREAVFPGYIFVAFDPATAPWRRVNSTLGIVRLLSTPSKQPAIVPQAFMEALIARCDASGLLQPERMPAEGDTVTIMSGPFAETVTMIESLDGQGRVNVLLNLMGQAVRVSLSNQQIRIE